MNAPDSVYKLVENFQRDEKRFKHPEYNETQLRVAFINPLFVALGWNIGDLAQVSHEDRVLVDGKPKRPDYGFRVNENTQFFLETKKPALNLKDDPSPAYQLRRYGWSGNLPVSVLSDFEEFIIYDCRLRPQRFEPASKARLTYYRYPEYVDNWEKLYELFSREAVADGALRRLVEGEKIRGALGVDQAFLREMEGWRESIAKDMALHNPQLTQRQLNHLVQRAIDRIVFLRIAEDRNIESYGRLQRAAGDGKHVYDELKSLFNEADDKYNSGLFHFGKEERASDPDEDSLQINLSNEPLRDIIDNLYYPNSPYEFSVLPADILGQVYERFLGKVIELTSSGMARVEDKPEVRKAGGVYYTPTYIVDYIVENTVGKLLVGKTPDQAAELRILDPACGSGSFLTGAYQYLLDWHLKFYREHPNQYRNRRRETADGMVLTTQEKRRILQNNIYGVDLDQNAVEVSKLSLLLKMLENERGSDATGLQTAMFAAGGRILPDLSGNIKWGNSLIGSDFYNDKQMTLFDDEAVYKVKPFDWESKTTGFGEIMAAGGFDAVIGNPPYVILGADVIPLQQIQYLRNYEVAQYKTDLYHLFLERGIQIMKCNGLLSLITPNPWLTQKFTSQLRRYIVDKTRIIELVVFDHLVFEDANVYTSIVLLQNRSDNRVHEVSVKNPENAETLDAIVRTPSEHVQQRYWQESESYVFETRLVGEKGEIVSRLVRQNPPLGDVARASLGCQAYNRTKHTFEQIRNRVFHADTKLSDDYLPELAGKDVGRYTIHRKRGTWIKYGPWLHDYRTMDWLVGPRILIREIPGSAPYKVQACFVEDMYCNYKTILNVNPSQHTDFDMKYITGLLNSKIISFIYPYMSNKLVSRSFPRLSVGDLRRIPIRIIDFDNPADVARHDQMVELVNTMLDLHKQLPDLSGIRCDTVQAQIERTDAAIDALVYELYDLTAAEIAIVEGR